MNKFEFPIVKNVSSKLATDDIEGMNPKQTRKAMTKMFHNFEKQYGYKIAIKGNNLPTRVLIPNKNK